MYTNGTSFIHTRRFEFTKRQREPLSSLPRRSAACDSSCVATADDLVKLPACSHAFGYPSGQFSLDGTSSLDKMSPTACPFLVDIACQGNNISSHKISKGSKIDALLQRRTVSKVLHKCKSVFFFLWSIIARVEFLKSQVGKFVSLLALQRT